MDSMLAYRCGERTGLRHRSRSSGAGGGGVPCGNAGGAQHGGFGTIFGAADLDFDISGRLSFVENRCAVGYLVGGDERDSPGRAEPSWAGVSEMTAVSELQPHRPPRGPRLTTRVITLQEAKDFVERHHRHHKPPVGHKLSIGVRVVDSDALVGVAIVSRPVARAFDDGGWTLEVSRTCTDGTRNANSALYGAVWRICRELGARRVITYTQAGETGASLRAAGYRPIARRREHPGWNRPSRPRTDKSPTSVERVLWLRGEPFETCHELDGNSHETLRLSQCAQCGRELPKAAIGPGRPRRTCSDACRKRQSRARRSQQTPARPSLVDD